ncbi:pyridoxamine 5'-phosphate oxidase family protein [Ensifer adhaerens]|uniref:pyridoxamine 5'-phosphate oxidase family protein n=1 Tax=Ensifer adhaerens TaxID=106592 RepID=UPI001C4DDD83|nr:pyridoxamine 5'-phosphate oxidase family protein [Ensifer adhaerens]MBW0366691.1 pyridoxamine 5'-phosphate oxidase family protein [Ensifer adhaerens]UCM21936.1 pyridoxamine 5'-phosphate oxidase family protein [Ensifer adhaerens]
MHLEEVDASAWSSLEAATVDPKSGFRFINLCSVGAAGRPQARMVVLRRSDTAARLLEIHTDTRSRKWLELSRNPIVTILGFCASTRVQLRLVGLVCLHPPGSDLAEKAWSELSAWTRSTYAGGPPGDEPGNDEPVPASGEANGKAFFGVVSVRAESLDWFELRRADNRRALFEYSDLGALVAARWINP